jgi:putative ABC transport system permease protein
MSVLQSASYAWRSLRRAPVFTAAVVLTLTIGIGAAAAIFTVVNGVLLRPLPYGDADRLVGAWHDLPPVHLLHAQQTAGTYFTYKQYAHTIEDIAEYNDGSVSVNDPDGRIEPQRMDVGWVSANIFSVLRVSPILGRTFSEAEDAPKGPTTVVLSEGLWRTRFGGDRNVIGKKLVVSGKTAEIIGVMPGKFRFPAEQTKLWLASQLDPHDPYPGGFNYSAVARLKPGVTIEAAERDFANVLPRVVESFPNLAPGVPTSMLLEQAKPIPKLVPMRDDLVGDIARTLWIVAAAAALVLLVTCANVANLLLVRADGRHRELSVRAALGAGRGQVLAQFFTESALLAVISSVLAIGATALGIRLLVSAGPREIPRLGEINVDMATVGFTIVVALLVSVICSVIPAVRFMRGDAFGGLRDGGRGGTVGGRRQRARSVLVAAQMAFALVVLAASGLMIRSFQRLHAVKPGFNPDGVATLWVSLPQSRYATDADVSRFYVKLLDRVRQIPGVQAAGISSRMPLEDRGNSTDPLYVEGDATYDKAIPPLQLYTKVDGDYFKTMGIPLLAGRTFERLDALTQVDGAIISQVTAITFFHDSTGRAALGKRFRELPGGSWHTIIGVVGSARDTSLMTPPSGAVYFPEAVTMDSLDASVSRAMAIVARTNGDALAITRAIQGAVREADPTLPTFDVRTMRTIMAGSVARLSFTMVILGVAAAVTLVLGVIGLYGVIAYIVTMRTREIGVRIALGAQPSSVMVMVTRQGLMLCVAGVAVGVGLSLMTARFLRTLLFEVAPTDPLTLVAASLTLIVFALVACWIPARRASLVNPTEALRAD